MTREDGIGYCGQCGRRALWVTVGGFGGCEVDGRGPLNWERPYPETDVRDRDGVRIARGQNVGADEVGTVVDVTPPDVDYSDRAERAVRSWPEVVVEYDDGTVERFLAEPVEIAPGTEVYRVLDLVVGPDS